MELTKPQFLAFRLVAAKPGIILAEYMEDARQSRQRAYSILSSLSKAGLIESLGRPAKYIASGTAESMLLSRLLHIYGSYPLEKVLPGKNYSLLSQIIQKGKTAGELMEASSLSRSQTYNLLTAYMRMGLVKKDSDRYYIASDHPLKKCLEEYAQPCGQSELQGYGPIIWKGPGEYLVLEEKQPAGARKRPWKYAAASAYARYGVSTIPPKNILYVSDRENEVIKRSSGGYTSLEDTLIYGLLSAGAADRKLLQYVLIVNKDKTDIAYLRKKAQKYGIANELEDLLYDIKPVKRF